MKKLFVFPLALILLLPLALGTATAAALPATVCVTDTVAANTGADVADALQALIDANPNHTIYFPDGEYLVSHSLCTPADPAKSVDLQLANYAVVKATDDFAGGAVICLGGKDPYNTTWQAGSNYGLYGGVIDGNMIADGVSIDSGRETKVQNTAIKHTVVGLHIGFGANSGSSDADISDINIIGNGAADSVGMLIEGFDNNLYTYCYSDQFQTAFKIVGNGRSVYDNCFAYWWSGEGGSCTGFQVEGDQFNATVTNTRIDFRGDTDNTVYDGPLMGSGVFDRLLIDEGHINANRDYRAFTKTSPLFQLKELFHRLKAFFYYLKALFVRE